MKDLNDVVNVIDYEIGRIEFKIKHWEEVKKKEKLAESFAKGHILAYTDTLNQLKSLRGSFTR